MSNTITQIRIVDLHKGNYIVYFRVIVLLLLYYIIYLVLTAIPGTY